MHSLLALLSPEARDDDKEHIIRIFGFYDQQAAMAKRRQSAPVPDTLLRDHGIVTADCEGDFSKYLQDNVVTVPEMVDFLTQIARGLYNLHKVGTYWFRLP